MVCKGAWKWNFANPQKVPEYWGSLDSDTFFQNGEIPLVSTLTGCMKCLSFSVHSCADLCGSVWVPRWQKRRHFSWPLEVLTSGIFHIWKKCWNPEYLMILAGVPDFQNTTLKYLYRPCKVFRLFLFFHPLLCRSMRVPWQEKWGQFAWPVRILKSVIFQIWKSTRILMGILPLLSDFQNSNFKYP
jgi:hypothetical protein